MSNAEIIQGKSERITELEKQVMQLRAIVASYADQSNWVGAMFMSDSSFSGQAAACILEGDYNGAVLALGKDQLKDPVIVLIDQLEETRIAGDGEVSYLPNWTLARLKESYDIGLLMRHHWDYLGERLGYKPGWAFHNFTKHNYKEVVNQSVGEAMAASA